MNMTGIIFSEIYNGGLDVFTADRNMGAIPFGGRYRLVDFVLSNMVNSGITNIGVLATQHYHSLMDHLSNTQEWDLNRKKGGLLIIPPFATESYNHNVHGKLAELRNALDYLQDSTSPYVLLADAQVVYNMDYRPVLEAHIASGRDITVVANKEDGTNPGNFFSVFQTDEDGTVTSVLRNYPARAGDYANMNVYVIGREKLIEVVRECTARGLYHLERDFIQSQFNRGELTINLYPFEGTVLRVRNVDEYFSNCLSLTDECVGAALFRPDRPVYTRVHDEVPTYYGNNCQVSECIIADGCIVDGSAQHSVLSRGVQIGTGADIKNCIIMQGSVIGEGAVLENVIVDKWATISAGSVLKGLPSAPVIIRKGATV